MGLYKILKYIAALLGAVGIALLIWMIAEGPDQIKTSADLQASILDPFLIVTYIILGITILSVLVFVAIRLVNQNIKETLLSLAAFVVIFLISFFSASGEALSYANGASISESGAKWMNTGINMFFILIVLAIVAMIVSSVRRLTFSK